MTSVRTSACIVGGGPAGLMLGLLLAKRGADVLVLAPRGTVLKVIERKGPWVTVELTPELRKTATPMRWYKNESRGFIHDSQLEPAKGGVQRFWNLD